MDNKKERIPTNAAPGIYVTAAPGIYVEVKGDYEGLKDNLEKCRQIEDDGSLDNIEISIRRAYECGVCGGMDWYRIFLVDCAERAQREGKTEIAQAITDVGKQASRLLPALMTHTMRSSAGKGYCEELRLLHGRNSVILRE